MNTNYSKINEEFKGLAELFNKLYYPDHERSIQEELFYMGLNYCTDRPKFYTECTCFWNYYIRKFYDKLYYFLSSPTIRTENRLGKVSRLLATYNLSLELPDELRQDIFIEYQTLIDQKLKPKNKTVQVGVKNKKVHLKEI